MSGLEFLSKIKALYPEEKPVAFNYTEARKMMLALAGRIVNLEAQQNDRGENAQ